MEELEHYQEDPEKLILLAQQGDSEAFGRLYKIYYTPVYRYIFLRTRRKAETEDIAQTVFLKVYNSLNTIKDFKSPPLAFFFTVARNALIDHWRKEGHGTVYDDELLISKSDEAIDNTDRIETKETKELIHSALGILTEDQQEIIRLKFLSELSNKEISEMIGKSEEAIRQLQSRALKLLRAYLKRDTNIE